MSVSVHICCIPTFLCSSEKKNVQSTHKIKSVDQDPVSYHNIAYHCSIDMRHHNPDIRSLYDNGNIFEAHILVSTPQEKRYFDLLGGTCSGVVYSTLPDGGLKIRLLSTDNPVTLHLEPIEQKKENYLVIFLLPLFCTLFSTAQLQHPLFLLCA